MSYQQRGNDAKLVANERDLNRDLSVISDPAIAAVAKEAASSGKAFNAALAANDIPARDQAFADARDAFAEYRTLCGDTDDEYSSKILADAMAEGIVAPTRTDPGPVTPTGTERALGETVSVDLPSYDPDEPVGRFTFAVTAVEQAPESDLLKIRAADRADIGALYYVRAQLKPLSEGPAVATLGVEPDVAPQYLMTTSDGQPAHTVNFQGEWKPCLAQSNAFDLCLPVSVSKGASISTVSVTSFERGVDGPEALYTWTVA